MKVKARSLLGSYLEKMAMSKAIFARRIGATPKQVHDWCENDESGISKSTPPVGYLLRMCNELNTDVRELYDFVLFLNKCDNCGEIVFPNCEGKKCSRCKKGKYTPWQPLDFWEGKFSDTQNDEVRKVQQEN